jgi:hypothetical protein
MSSDPAPSQDGTLPQSGHGMDRDNTWGRPHAVAFGCHAAGLGTIRDTPAAHVPLRLPP